MPGSDPLTHALAVPGARLYYERRGTGPLLLLIGSPMDSAGLAGLAAAMAGDYTVVTYDPRGIGNSSCQDPRPGCHARAAGRRRAPPAVGPRRRAGVRLRQQRRGRRRARPGHRAPRPGAQAGRPRTSGGRVAVRQRPAARPDPGHLRHLRAEGADQAMGKFMAHAGLGGTPGQEADAPRWEPSPEQMARMRATTDVFLAHLIRPTTEFKPDIEALRAASTHIVVAAGATSKGQLAPRSTVALADQLGTPVVEFPGDHGGFVALPEQCGRVLDQVLTQTT